MKMDREILIALLLTGVGCSSGPGSNGEATGETMDPLRSSSWTEPAPVAIGNSGLYLKRTIALPNLPAGAKFSYDVGAVDRSEHRYYLADRTNKSLDIIDARTYAVRHVPGFTGAGASNDVSGPDGVVIAPHGYVYVGDVDGVKVIDPEAGVIVKTIPIATSGLRTDEGCYDPDDRIVMFQNPADSPPFVTFISAETNAVVARLELAGSSGLEACVYDRRTRSFFLNNDGTARNPGGEVDVIPAASVVARTPRVSASHPLGECGPTGIELDAQGELVIACDAPAGALQKTLLLGTRNGAIRRTITQVGGGDEVAFDRLLDRFYVAARNMTASGVSETGVAGAKLTPVLGIIDARSGRWIASIPVGAGAHSVATDADTGEVFVPAAPTASAAGGVQVYAPVCGDSDGRHERRGCEREEGRREEGEGDGDGDGDGD